MNHSVYVITSSAQSGKSIVSLGLMQMLKRTTPNVAFFKPLIENKNFFCSMQGQSEEKMYLTKTFLLQNHFDSRESSHASRIMFSVMMSEY